MDIQRVQYIIEKALKLPDKDRPTYLDCVCGGDHELRSEVESLLPHAEIPDGDFLRPPAPHSSRNQQAGRELLGRHVGACHIRQVIASGGMGTVYEAEQEQPRRKVAVKMMHAWTWSRSVKRRFEFEAQTLARLTHPNVARIYAAGTHGDMPYFVMEYVPDALPITDFAKQHALDTTARLRLFLDVCDAVQHGHRKGIIHRDLKPSNILVDGEGHVKIIDFGVARSTDSDVAVTTLHTGVGDLIGTLQYMSPEQCDADPIGLDIRTDIYSLGVVLYQLVCERLPYDVSRTTVAQAARVICEQLPARPSAVHRRLRGDVELILLRAIEKDRERRYQSAADLARDIRHLLNREPIEAKPPTFWTHTSRFIARHPVVGTTSVCLIIFFCTLVATKISVFYLHALPDRIQRSPDGQWARLVSKDGNILKEWTSNNVGEIHLAELAERPVEFGAGVVAVLAFGWHRSSLFSGRVCAFDEGSEFERTIWEQEIHDEDLPRLLHIDRGFKGADFAVTTGKSVDVFPQHSGSEIVAVHQHTDTTQSALRVYDLRGELLYQIWLDAQVNGLHWMDDAGLLILAGLNGRAFWPERGHSEVKNARHPCVVLAVRPTIGYVVTDYLGEIPGDRPGQPVWHRCLLPPELTGDIRLNVRPAVGRFDPGHFVSLSVLFTSIRSGFGVILDEHGNIVPGTRTLHNEYVLHRDGLPDPESLYLGALPPIRE